MKTNRWMLIGLIIIIAVSFCAMFNSDNLKEAYFQVCHSSGAIAHYNNNGKLDGQVVVYDKGKIFSKTYFRNGFKEGLGVWFDVNTGKVKRQIFFSHGILNGVEKGYYANGSLDYITHWVNGKASQSAYHYSNDGLLNTYVAFDISKDTDNSFCYIAYDKTGKFHQILGDTFSPLIYSMCRDSLVILNNKAKYSCITDLYVTVATPPELTPEIDIRVNGVDFKPSITQNTTIVRDVFKEKGSYVLTLYGRLINKNGGHTVNADTLAMKFIKL